MEPRLLGTALRAHQRLHDLGVDHRAALGDVLDRGHQLAAVLHALLQHVRAGVPAALQQRQPVLRVDGRTPSAPSKPVWSVSGRSDCAEWSVLGWLRPNRGAAGSRHIRSKRECAGAGRGRCREPTLQDLQCVRIRR